MLSREPKAIVVAQPTRGLDVAATEYVHGELLAQRERGAAVLLVSEDLDELLALADRLIVMYEGRIVGRLRRRGRSRAARAADGRPGRGRGRVIAVRLEPRPAPSRWFGLILIPAAVAVTAVVTVGFVLAAGANPLDAYDAFIVDPLTSRFTGLEVLVAATPLLFTGAAVAIAFRAGFWNIGAEGQLLAGAIAPPGRARTWAGCRARSRSRRWPWRARSAARSGCSARR